jgi:hypothetical protein
VDVHPEAGCRVGAASFHFGAAVALGLEFVADQGAHSEAS